MKYELFLCNRNFQTKRRTSICSIRIIRLRALDRQGSTTRGPSLQELVRTSKTFLQLTVVPRSFHLLFAYMLLRLAFFGNLIWYFSDVNLLKTKHFWENMYQESCIRFVVKKPTFSFHRIALKILSTYTYIFFCNLIRFYHCQAAQKFRCVWKLRIRLHLIKKKQNKVIFDTTWCRIVQNVGQVTFARIVKKIPNKR